MGGKLLPLRDAVHDLVSDGDTIALGGWIIARCVVAAVHELIRQGKKNLTVCQGLSGFDTDLLAGAGCIKRLVTAGGSLDAFGRLNRINELGAAGKLEVEENSALGMASRFLAGSLGIPFMATRGLLGSSILEGLQGKSKAAVEIKSPFTGEKVVLLSALTVKTAIIHVQRADEYGNAQVLGPLWDTLPIASSAERVLLTAEEIVPSSAIKESPEKTLIPGFRVEAVSHVPFGSYPTSCYRWYDYDAEHLKEYAKASAGQDTYDGYLRDNVLSHDDFGSFLRARCPPERMEQLRAKGGRGY